MTLEDALSEDQLIKDLRLSFSRVSEFDRSGPKSLIHRKKISGEFLDFGSLVDDMLQPDFNINDNYYIFDGEKPSAMLYTLCEYLIREHVDSDLIINNTTILEGIKHLGLWKSTKEDSKLLAKYTKEADNYVTAMIKSVDKTLVTNILVQEAEEMVALLKTHEYTKDFFKKYLLYQESIEFRFLNFNFLSLLDYIEINHDNKTVQGIDLKTGSKPVNEFMSNFVKFRYYQQAKLYQLALIEYMNENGFEDYELLPFKFLYCGRYEKIPTFIEVSDKWENAAFNGFKTNTGYEYKGLIELVENIEWHWRNDIYSMSKEQYEANGNIVVNDDFINLL